MSENVIVIDSNFLFLPIQFKIDYLNEIYYNLEGKTRFIIFKQIFDELEAKEIRKKQGIKFQTEYKVGLTYLNKNKSKYIIEFNNERKNQAETTDEFLIRKCNNLKKKGNRVFLATNDSKLRKEAKNNEISTIFVRQKRFLAFE